jgi:hypothetical protein
MPARALAATVPGENIYGSGSSAEAQAQNGNLALCGASGWVGWTGVWHCTAADHASLDNDPVAAYTVTPGIAGLAEFGNVASTSCASAAPAGQLNPQCDPTSDGQPNPELDAFIGTEDAPTAADLAAAGSAAGAGVQELTIPVAQTPVAMLLSLPVGISVGAGGEIKYPTSVLDNLWNATVAASPACPDSGGNTWCDLLEASGLKRITSGTPTSSQFLDSTGDLGGPITRMVIVEGGGTTHAFQGFLWEAGDPMYPLSMITQQPASWPPFVTVQDCTTAGACGTSSANGTDAELVTNATATPGSVGYADLADAALASPGYSKVVQTTMLGGTHQIVYAVVQDDGGDSNIVYTAPSNSPGTVNVYTGAHLAINQSTCPQPMTTPLVGCWLVPSTPTGTWNGGGNPSNPGTFASDPDVYDHSVTSAGSRSKAYPIVAVMFAEAWTDYDSAGSNLDSNGYYYDNASCPPVTNCATDAGDTASSFLRYVTGSGSGNLSGAKVYYGRLPALIQSKAAGFAKAITP